MSSNYELRKSNIIIIPKKRCRKVLKGSAAFAISLKVDRDNAAETIQYIGVVLKPKRALRHNFIKLLKYDQDFFEIMINLIFTLKLIQNLY